MADLTGKLKLDTSDFNAKADAAVKKAGELGDKTKVAAEKGGGAWGTAYDKVNLALTGLASGMQIAGQVIAGVQKAYDATVGSFVDYADSMRLGAQVAGVTTEEMSRLVQAADDYRVPVEKMQQSMELALKNGFVPTIENVAALSDELLAIKDPAERAATAAAIFGKSYADVMPFLMAGGSAIKGTTAAIADNLVVTGEMAQSAKDTKDAIDNFDDSWTGARYNLGKAIAPTAAKVFNAIADSLGDEQRFKAVGVLNKDLEGLGLNLDALTKPYEGLFGGITKTDSALFTQMSTVKEWSQTTTKSFTDSGDSAEVAQAKTAELFNTGGMAKVAADQARDLALANNQYAGSLASVGNAAVDEAVFLADLTIKAGEQADAAAAAAAEWDTYVAAVGNVTSLTANFSSIIGLAKNYDKILIDITEQTEIMADEPVGSEKWLQAKDNIELLKGSMTDLANQMTLDMYQAAIAIDGITRAEADSYFQMAEDMGLISTEASDAAMAAWDKAYTNVNALTIDDKEAKITADASAAYATFDLLEQYQLLDKEQRVFVRTYTGTSGGGGQDPYENWGNASGGPVYAGQNVRWGEYGPETFVAAENGRILSRADSINAVSQASGGGGEGGGDTYILNMPTSSNPADVRTAFELMEAWA